MEFTDRLWRSIEVIYGKILAHPFIRGLTEGSLSEEAFRFYVMQDALYLKQFARGLAVLGAKAPVDAWFLMFVRGAAGVFEVERVLHEAFMGGWGLGPKDLEKTPMAPTNLMYTSYLLNTAYERPFHEAMGAFLPCYWIYLEVGKALEKQGSPNKLFQQWIGTYASEAFEGSVRAVLGAMNAIAEELTDNEKERVREHFILTSKMEYLFWEMGYSRQEWGI